MQHVYKNVAFWIPSMLPCLGDLQCTCMRIIILLFMAMCLELGPALGWSRFIFKWNFTYLHVPWLQYLNMNESLQVSTHFKANLVTVALSWYQI